jgi:hypothetical protein
MLIFLWDEANVEHIAEHGVLPDEPEYVIRCAKSPYPERIGDGKLRVWGQTRDGKYLQVVFVEPTDDEISFDALTPEALSAMMDDDAVFVRVIHAMPMTDDMKRQFKRRT